MPNISSNKIEMTPRAFVLKHEQHRLVVGGLFKLEEYGWSERHQRPLERLAVGSGGAQCQADPRWSRGYGMAVFSCDPHTFVRNHLQYRPWPTPGACAQGCLAVCTGWCTDAAVAE